jgi:hypothetical protein
LLRGDLALNPYDSPGDFNDGTHPAASGYGRLANWFVPRFAAYVTAQNTNINQTLIAPPRALMSFVGGPNGDNATGDAVNTGLIVGTDVNLPTAGSGNLFIQTNDTAAINKGGSLVLGGRFNSASTNGAAFAGLKGLKENAADGDLAGALVFYTRATGGAVSEAARLGGALPGSLTLAAGAGSGLYWFDRFNSEVNVLFSNNGVGFWQINGANRLQVNDLGDAQASNSMNVVGSGIYKSLGTPGVTCTAGSLNLATFTAAGGIVTHC